MTFDDLVAEVAERLNLTSAPAIARIGRSVNERYRWVSSSIGLQTSVRATITSPTVMGSPLITFPDPEVMGAPGVEKLYALFNANVSPPIILMERSFDEMRERTPLNDPAHHYAIQRMGANSITLLLDATPSTEYDLTADVEQNQSTLSGTDVPSFAEDFHDILLYGAMATELDKMEKYEFANKQEAKYEARLSSLRMFIAKSGYLDIFQGKDRYALRRNRGWGESWGLDN